MTLDRRFRMQTGYYISICEGKSFNLKFFFIINILCINIFTSSLHSQDVSFSHFFLYSLNENPAVAGSANDPRLFLHYRNQWPAFGSTFVTYQASYDQYVKNMHGGFGINLLRDNMAGGALSSTNLDLMYSYRTKVSNFFTVQYGLQASFLFKSLNMGSLISEGETDAPTSTSTTSPQPDVSAGVMGFGRFTQIGFAVSHLNPGLIRFNYTFVKSPVKFSFFLARNIKIYNKYKVKENGFMITPAVMIQKQGASIMANYGVGATIGSLFAGVWMKNNLPFQLTTTIFSIGYTFNNIRIGYSYDYELLSLKNVMPFTGAHEITLVAIFPVDPKTKRYGPIKCPDFDIQ